LNKLRFLAVVCLLPVLVAIQGCGPAAETKGAGFGNLHYAEFDTTKFGLCLIRLSWTTASPSITN
jgi:hypothetical protein